MYSPSVGQKLHNLLEKATSLPFHNNEQDDKCNNQKAKNNHESYERSRSSRRRGRFQKSNKSYICVSENQVSNLHLQNREKQNKDTILIVMMY